MLRSDSSGTNPKVRILVAEDDGFQRLSVIDIAEFCGYEVVDFANGKEAQQELLSNGDSYDLVLLDLMMPEMDGLELLIFMQNEEKLREIPVIMMSSDGEMESVAACIQNGAKDYLVKPIRPQNIKGLVSHARKNLKRKNEENSSSLENYQILRELGAGAAGTVSLVRHVVTGEEFALKTINLKLLGPAEREHAKNEVPLLKVLNGPTIVRYYEHFTQKDTISIIMEYAEKGSLSDVIKEHKMTGKPISNEQIIKWTAQSVIALHLMHSKRILHRDIKCQNMFLAKGNVIKIGDFGVSKVLGNQSEYARTHCGTPYFMSPELCLNEVYNQKSDIWALGCALYELVALQMPFDANNLPDLMRVICDKEPDPLPNHIDPKMKLLIYSMLQKDQKLRPSITEIAERNFIQDEIIKFVIEHDCKDSVGTIIIENPKQDDDGNKLPPSPEKVNHTIPLEDLANTIHSSIKLQTLKVGMFGKEENVVTGEDLVNWFKKDLESTNLDEIKKSVEGMMEQELLYSLSGSSKFEPSAKALYRFQVDKPGIAANMRKIYKGEPRNPLQLTIELVEKMNEVIKEIRVEEVPGEVTLKLEKLQASVAFREFNKLICELPSAPLSTLAKSQKIAYFLNIYQVMHMHKIIKENTEKVELEGIFGKVKSLVKSDANQFYYNLNQMNFSIDEIIHGIFRGNKKAPNAYYFKTFGDRDPRNSILEINDPRMLFVIIPEDKIPSKLEVFTPNELDAQLDKVCRSYLSTTVIYDNSENELTLPKKLKIYAADFGDQKALIDFISKYNKITDNQEDVKEVIKEGKVFFSTTIDS